MTFISYAQNAEDVVLWRALHGVERGFYIDVGAQDPIVDSVTKAFYERGWRGINIEPVREYYDKLVADRPEDINLMVVAAERSGTIQFFEVAGTGLSTTNEVFAERYKREGRPVIERAAACLPLSAICGTYQVDEVHFLKIDAEGAEGAVLAGFDFSRVRPWIILVEATEPDTHEPIFLGWHGLLQEHGYDFTYFDALNRFYVARERAELKPAFGAPPSVLDSFLRYSEWEALQRSERSAHQVEELQAQLQAEREHMSREMQAQLAQREYVLAEKLALLFRRARVVLAPPDSRRARMLRAISKVAYSPFVQVRSSPKTETDLALIRSSGLFDETWYLANNADVASAKMDPARHYLLFGGSEGRDPSRDFSSGWYLDTHQDVKVAGENPLLHYLRYGQAEGRATRPTQAEDASTRLALSTRVEGGLAQPWEEEERLRQQGGGLPARQMTDAVSIVIPTFNGSKTIRGTLDGVMKQTYSDYEVVVVDDGSTDSTGDIVREMIPSATIIKQGSNQGTMAARQAGIDAATGDFIALLDQDDKWFPEMLETEVSVLRQHPEIGLVLANMKAVSEDGNELGFNVVPTDKCYSPSWEELLMLHPIAASTALFRKELATSIGGLDLRFGFSGALGDSDTFARISEVTRIHFVDRCLGYYCWSEYRPGRLVSFLDNLEVYARKYLDHPRLSGEAGMQLRARFAQSSSGYTLQICRMLLRQEKGNLPQDLAFRVERHQASMRQLFGDLYRADVVTQTLKARVGQPHGKSLPLLTALTNIVLPVGSNRRRRWAPFLRAGRVLITEGPASLGREVVGRIGTRRREQQSEEHSPSASLTREMRNTRKTKVLVIDDYIPAIRYGSGFPRLYKMLTCLSDLGYQTTFFPVGNPVKVQPETSELQHKGVEVFWGSQVGFEEFAESRAGYYDVVLISRPQVFERIHPSVVRWWPNAAILYDAEALFYARDIVKAEIAGAAMQDSEKTKIARKEMRLIEKADVVISVSQKTKDIMLEESSQRNIEVWEHIQDVPGSDVPFGQRAGILHFGSFFAGPGSPNEDAVLYFVGEVLPEIRRALSCKLYVVGTSPTPAVMRLATEDIEVVGYVETPKDYFDMCRVNVVPTRVFATGTPLKLIEAMSCGIPSVVNGPIASHLGLVHGKEVLVAEGSREFATMAIRLYSDELLWQHLHRNSIQYVNDNYSYAKMRQRMDFAIRRGLEVRAKRA